MRRLLICGLLLVLPCWGQGRGNPIQLAPQKALRRKVAAVPLIAHPANDAQRRVNARLQGINDGLRPTLKECDAGYAEFLKRMHGHPDEETSTEWERKVTVTMAGPRYLSLLISDYNFCGGAHQSFSESAAVFDLETGTPVDWVAMFPQGRAKLEPKTPWNGIPAEQIEDARLNEFYLSRLKDRECAKDIANYGDTSLLIWLDAAKKRVALGMNMSGALMGCPEDIEMTPEEAQRLGFAEELVRAVEAGPVR